jgi:LmbE family N-acetylglucosaminyl deacetylase
VTAAVTTLDELIAPSRHIFLSPHYDDIAISCGGTARLLAEHGRQPVVALIFGSEPAPDHQYTSFAQRMHRDWGFDAQEVIASRRAEEAVASQVLGTTDQFLPFHDAIYRGERYLGDDDLFSVPAEDEGESLPAAIVEAIGLAGEANADTRIYTPLGSGKHVDHQLAFMTGVLLAQRGWQVWCYEDLPYSIKPGALDNRLATAGVELTEAARIDVSSVWDAKIDAIMSYPSQLETVFGRYVGAGTTRAEISAAMHRFATSIDGEHAVERFWGVK